MIRVEARRRLPAPPERVWTIYTDWVGWTRWARLGRVRLARAGEASPNGVGAIRAIDNLGFEVEEEIIAFEPSERLRYRVVGGPVPMRDHEGEVVLEEDGTGTMMTWRCRFAPTLPGSGPLMRLVVRTTFRHVMRQLDRQLRR